MILLGQSYQSNLCRLVRQWISQINKSVKSWKHFHSENKRLLLILRIAHYKAFELTFYEALKSIKAQGDCDIIPVMKVTQNEGLWKQDFTPLVGLNHALCGDYGYRRVTRAGKGVGGGMGGGVECAAVPQYRRSLKSSVLTRKHLRWSLFF